MIQIRHVPEVLHRRLKARAAMEGVSMSQYVMRALERALERPIRRDLLAAIGRQPELAIEPSPADLPARNGKHAGTRGPDEENSGDRER